MDLALNNLKRLMCHKTKLSHNCAKNFLNYTKNVDINIYECNSLTTRHKITLDGLTC